MKSLRKWAAGVCALFTVAHAETGFVPLTPLPKPAILARSSEYPSAQYAVGHLVDGDLKTSFASNNEGTNTVVEFGFEAAAQIAAIRHVDRNDPATVAESEFEFLDESGARVALVPVTHANKRSGETFFSLTNAVTARRVRWHVTKPTSPDFRCVGGAEMTFFGPLPAETAPTRDSVVVRVLPFLLKAGGQPATVAINHPYVQSAAVSLRIGTREVAVAQLHPGANSVEIPLPARNTATRERLELVYNEKTVAAAEFEQKPIRPMTIFVVPHSHTDIGFTEIQTAIEKKQTKNVSDGLEAARRTANYPEGARFVWNVEVGWAADLYLQRATAAQREEFLEAVRKGQIALNGMYLNELTGLCRPEELIQLFRFATKISHDTGVPIDTAMISDVPGYTWGTVTALSQAGIKYLSAAPNYFDRIGTIIKEWENKPFYWLGPDGKTKTLVWIPFWGYAMSHVYNEMSPRLVSEFYEGLEKRAYPYDIAYVRWSGHGDNATPDPAICEFVRDWNAKYAWPRFVISSASAPFHALEEKYAATLPIVRGDWSPYWEDGAGSSALETALNRNSSDQLSAAATAFAILKPGEYPTGDFENAWRNVLLYSEHTWGAWCSVNGPERKETREQWDIKKSYTEMAHEQSAALLKKALGSAAGEDGEIELVNTLSWPRSELVLIPAQLSNAGDRVIDEKGVALPSQRLRSGELAFKAQNVPALGTARYKVKSGGAEAGGSVIASAHGRTLSSGRIRVSINEQTGAICELTDDWGKSNLAETADGQGLNDFIYMIGDEASQAKKNGAVHVSVGEAGPLIASLVIESEAPGCKSLRRELRVVAGGDFVEVINVVDKTRLEAKNYSDKEGKESLNFGFPFNVPDAEMLIDVPLGAFRPDADQLPSACKNWLTVGRWVEVSNLERGVTWVTLDAPLIEVGELSANLLNSQTNPEVWRKTIPKSQRLFSWAMNNHWGTNYRAYQEGPVVFRYVLRPHAGGNNPAEATRFATQFSEPLQTRRGTGSARPSLLKLSNNDVVVTGLKPSEDGKAIIIRLFGAAGKEATTQLIWGDRKPARVFLSNTAEAACEKAPRDISLPGYGLVTLRAEFAAE